MMLKLILIYFSGVVTGAYLPLFLFVALSVPDELTENILKDKIGGIAYGMAKKSRLYHCKSDNNRRC